MKIGIYDRWLTALGGGERMALALGQCLAADHTVEVIAHHPVDLDFAAAKLNLDLRRVQLRCVPELPHDEDYAPLTADYDLFIAASQTTFIPARSRHAWLLAFFPYPIELSAPARLRRRLGLWLRRQLLLPVYASGFYGAEASDGHLIRWTDGHGVLRLPINTGTIKVQFSITAHSSTTVYVNGQLHHTIEPAPDRGFVPISLDVPAHAPAATLELISAGHDQPIGTRHVRSVGAALRDVEIDHWRYRLYQRLFEQRFKHWGLRLLNIPSTQGAAALRTYATIIGISRFTQTWIQRYWSRDSELLFPPVEVDALKPGNKRNLILTVGRIFAGGHNKKHLPMIATFKQLVDGGLRDWEFHIAGSVGDAPVDRDYCAQVQQAARGYPIILHVNIAAAELQQLYGAAKIYWHASGYGEDEQRDPIKFEHFGITTVEAMVAGAVPVVIGKAGQLEVVENDVSGLHWQTLDELAEHTQRLMADETLWSRLSGNAIERSRLFSHAAFDKRVHELVDSLR
ncbi:MAG: glycosyltransferase family 4 protein [Thermoflexales bacterium]|nr:glycosyltransferase family 4 protein [Thermoflexales bacterium]